jgi:predicted HNH restriction endonuclease
MENLFDSNFDELPKKRKTKSDKLIHKKSFKKAQGACKICKESNYNLLDVHRIKPGAEGGKYLKLNCVTLCANCHRLTHSGELTIIEWIKATNGYLLKIVLNNEEKLI